MNENIRNVELTEVNENESGYISQQNSFMEPVKKKSNLSKKILISLITIIIISMLIVTFVPTVRNSFLMTILPAGTYYKVTQKLNIYEFINIFKNSNNEKDLMSVLDNFNEKKGLEYSFNIKRSEKNIADSDNNSFINIAQLTKDFTISGNMIADDKNNATANFDLISNGTKLTDIKAYLDSENIYMQMPMYSNDWLKIDNQTILNSNQQKNTFDYMTEEEKLDIFKKYMKLLYSNENGDTQITKGADYILGSKKYKVNEVTITYTKQEIQDIILDIKDEMMQDEVLRKAYLASGKTEYDVFVSDFNKELNYMADQNLLIVKTQIDNTGKIVGKTFIFDEVESKSFGIKTKIDKDNLLLNLIIKSYDIDLDCLCDIIVKDSVVNGELTCNNNDKSSTYNIENLKIIDDYVSGKITGYLDDERLLNLNLGKSDEMYQIDAKITKDDKDYMSMILEYKKSDDIEMVEKPDESNCVTSVNDWSGYNNFLNALLNDEDMLNSLTGIE